MASGPPPVDVPPRDPDEDRENAPPSDFQPAGVGSVLSSSRGPHPGASPPAASGAVAWAPLSASPAFQSQTKLKVRIRGWNGVATWKWVANDDTCGICRVAFEGCCPDCKIPGDDCPLVWGQCTHCFHIHCIMKWLQSQQAQQLCPMCRQDWKFKE
eukprot:snap_masked-scaffold321_size207582-processed-gene-1.4 protein:Tk05194 transcript:snap_masked-scaffold321_size207582-processed-gene-1.4-mRNA-1 annotation:"anaphase-promoting complex subunit 11"